MPSKPARSPKARSPRRQPLSREGALKAALVLADRHGLEGLSMRSLARDLKVEAMSLYHHVPNKDAILDGMVDLVFAEVAFPRLDVPWQMALRTRMASLREALLRHRWALGVLESRRQPGPVTLAHHDAVLGCLRHAGFSWPLAALAYAVLDSFVFGFVHTELTLPFEGPEQTHSVAGDILAAMPADAYPHLAAFAQEHVLQPGYAYSHSFPQGLDLILDGLARMLPSASAR